MNLHREYKNSSLDLMMHASLAAVLAVSLVVMAVWPTVQVLVI